MRVCKRSSRWSNRHVGSVSRGKTLPSRIFPLRVSEYHKASDATPWGLLNTTRLPKSGMQLGWDVLLELLTDIGICSPALSPQSCTCSTQFPGRTEQPRLQTTSHMEDGCTLAPQTVPENYLENRKPQARHERISGVDCAFHWVHLLTT